jgi:CHAT domain-containing protein/Tfp pilus assembly protein PilF
MVVRRKIWLVMAFAVGVIASVCTAQELKPGVVVEKPDTNVSGGFNPGVVVESIAKNSQAEQAGIQEDDALTSWSRGDAHGKLESPFDLSWVEFEQSPRGEVSLQGRRGAEPRVWKLGDVVEGGWGIQVRPEMPQDVLSLYLQGRTLARAGKLTEALDFWHRASVEARKNPPLWLEVWLLFNAANSLCAAHRWEDAEKSYQAIMEQAKGAGPAITAQILEAWAWTSESRNTTEGEVQRLYLEAIAENQKLDPESLAVARLLTRIGVRLRQLDDLGQAEDDYHRALTIAQKAAPNSLCVGRILLDLGRIAYKRSDFVEAERYERQALMITEKVAPGSIDDAWCLNALGLLRIEFSDFENAKNYLLQALAIREKLVPGGSMAGSSFLNLAIVANLTGNLAEAETDLQKDLAILEKLSSERNWTETHTKATVYSNLGDLAIERGDVARGEQYYRQALAIWEKLVPGSLLTASSLSGIGEAALRREDFATAERYLRQGLAIRNKLAPNSLDVASSLSDLGVIAMGQGNLSQADVYFRRALAIVRKRAPGNLDEVELLRNLGLVRARRRDGVEAENFLERALALNRKLAPESPYIVLALNDLGNVESGRGELAKAEQHCREALAIEEKQAPGSAEQAETLVGLAGIMHRKGDLDSAVQLFEQGLTAFENHTARLGGLEESRSDFRAKYASYYRDYINLLIEQKKPDAAFQVAERSRARTLLEMLAAAHADIRKGGDPALLEREHSLQELITAKSNRRVQLLNTRYKQEQLAAMDNELQDLFTQFKDIEGQIRLNSPSYAALTQPQPISAKEVQQQLLDDNTLLLEYSLGERRSYVFAVSANSLSAYELPKRAAIEATARRVYDILVARSHIKKGETDIQRMQRSGQAESQYPEASAALSSMILGPVAPLLEGKRLLIVSDGILQYIPFTALPSPGTKSAPVPLIADHEIVNLPSASVLQVLQRESAQRARPTQAVAVLADPVFKPGDERVNGISGTKAPRDVIGGEAEVDESMSQTLLLRSATEIGMADGNFPRLFYTRQEAESILKEAPVGKSMKAVDFQASRTMATSPELAQYRIIHFATHGLLNSEHPELSGLVLSLVDEHGKQQNGFLQLTDIYNLNLPADMVVLSACETGLGKEVRGEGLLGITRGFMYAGASRVMASLWKVDDAATAELMGRFYKGIFKDNLQPAAALQKAQVEMWKQKRWSSPYYWAGFVLQGQR